MRRPHAMDWKVQRQNEGKESKESWERMWRKEEELVQNFKGDVIARILALRAIFHSFSN